MSQTFNERLNQILPKLTSSDLLTNQGLGNEIGFWIFDYPPEEEMAMRAFLQDVVMPALANTSRRSRRPTSICLTWSSACWRSASSSTRPSRCSAPRATPKPSNPCVGC
jgi:hypothetical protein